VKTLNYEIADYNFEREHNIIVIVKTQLQLYKTVHTLLERVRAQTDEVQNTYLVLDCDKCRSLS